VNQRNASPQITYESDENSEIDVPEVELPDYEAPDFEVETDNKKRQITYEGDGDGDGETDGPEVEVPVEVPDYTDYYEVETDNKKRGPAPQVTW
jgi:hypothetical protein